MICWGIISKSTFKYVAKSIKMNVSFVPLFTKLILNYPTNKKIFFALYMLLESVAWSNYYFQVNEIFHTDVIIAEGSVSLSLKNEFNKIRQIPLSDLITR